MSLSMSGTGKVEAPFGLCHPISFPSSFETTSVICLFLSFYLIFFILSIFVFHINETLHAPS